ncbi:MraY family glycosyltransferase [Cognatilysobacter lacus]|uniref:Undecaprenyl/decaprenyl-phosphate alpha-N-acetylglucosaminyl 1-phosphate transferase n=1 Tax=Cognatilysobacter lacus TaxID=1643323 RepID=A0A5D8ZAV8_9GAMM|nr:MraY family glycosyltransferase [Lysobacter lacus]TZF91193.1 undecaprenyl/decaprenyl-phosphate alpha-N-acetylglucosaminyl 1-phosphate transferase [Lysobacter lacus]
MDSFASRVALSVALTALFLWTLQPLAYRFGLLDRPGGRKQHARPTPITGGLSIALAVYITILATTPASAVPWAYISGSFLLIVVGMLDDAFDLHWSLRVLAQSAAGLIMVYGGGVQVEYVGFIFSSTPIVLGPWAAPFTVFATIGIINAVNMCDGSDGLAGSLCLAALAMFGAAALYAGNDRLFADLLPFVSALVAFLAFNMRFPWQRRAKVFLGNAGSAFLGFTIAWVVFRLTQNAAHPVSPVLAPWLLAPPLIDCLVLIARRLKMGRSPFLADRDHMHHLLHEAGFGPNAIAVGLTTVSLVIGVAAALVLRTDAIAEGHLVVAFGVMLSAYYWLTSQRDRAMRILGPLNAMLRRVRGGVGTAARSPGYAVAVSDEQVEYVPGASGTR